MESHTQLLTRFYTAFQNKDAQGMAACYAPRVKFSDPVFSNLQGEEVHSMWSMLLERGKDLRIEFGQIETDETRGKAEWKAYYTFSKTGRFIENHIKASFTFENGKITTHTDQFDFYAWSRQAFGLTGLLMGWTPYFQKKVQSGAQESLRRYRM